MAAMTNDRANHKGVYADDVIDCHGLDTPERVCFYEQDFYVLSNFSAFRLRWRGQDFDTSEHAYQWSKFDHEIGSTARAISAPIRQQIQAAPSAHEAFKLAEANKHLRRVDWDRVKVNVMHHILCQKAQQHEYVRRKLLATGNRELVENSWRDDFWGWGPRRDGQNMLGKLWMEVRAELREQDNAIDDAACPHCRVRLAMAGTDWTGTRCAACGGLLPR